MIKWWKRRSRPEKWMIALAALLVIGIIVRWDYVSREAGDAFSFRFNKEGREQHMKDRPEYVKPAEPESSVEEPAESSGMDK